MNCHLGNRKKMFWKFVVHIYIYKLMETRMHFGKNYMPVDDA